MGLFGKKNCAICNEKVGLLGGLKLKNGYLLSGLPKN